MLANHVSRLFVHIIIIEGKHIIPYHYADEMAYYWTKRNICWMINSTKSFHHLCSILVLLWVMVRRSYVGLVLILCTFTKTLNPILQIWEASRNHGNECQYNWYYFLPYRETLKLIYMKRGMAHHLVIVMLIEIWCTSVLNAYRMAAQQHAIFSWIIITITIISAVYTISFSNEKSFVCT